MPVRADADSSANGEDDITLPYLRSEADAFELAQEAGITIIVAAGNAGRDAQGQWPW